MGDAKRRNPRGFDLATGFSEAERAQLSQLRAGAYRHARTVLERARSAPAAVQRQEIAALHREAVRALDASTDDFLRRAPVGAGIAGKIACRKGCNFCCHSLVEVSIVEAIAVADVIAASPDLCASVRTVAPKVRGLSALARMQAHIPCPLLREDACSVYADRPRSCRALTSYDVAACEDEFAHPAAERPPRLMFAWPRFLAMALTSGLATACSELKLQSNSVELIAGVDTVLADETAVARWLAGGNAFPGSPA